VRKQHKSYSYFYLLIVDKAIHLYSWGTIVVYEYALAKLEATNDINPDALAETDKAIFRPRTEHDAVTSVIQGLSRRVYCVLGMPLDAVDMDGALAWAGKAALSGRPCLLSTPNLNFLVNSQTKNEFRDSLLLSDLSIADGMPLIWIAKLLGLPIRSRVAGSELFDLMIRQRRKGRKIKIFFFGGGDGVAEKAAEAMNASSDGVRCVGTLNPGFGTIEDMSSAAIIERINASGADFLVVALGAQKGQEWLLRNHDRLKIPLRAHLGACMNFQAGTVARAPRLFQKSGLEWLWRIKEEPQLWRRYRHDGLALIRLMFTRVLPLVLQYRFLNRVTPHNGTAMEITARQAATSLTLFVKGHATEGNIDEAIRQFSSAFNERGPLTIDLSGAETVDQRFLGLLMMVHKQATRLGIPFHIQAGSRAIRRAFRLNAAEYLLSDQTRHEGETGVNPVAGVSRNLVAGDA
jgi:N-acetylglucosaminyldiphosphoundecaprenol N-acetyl-beta-D-mannosaminyltransferase